MKKAILVVSFGSTFENARKNNIDKTVNHIAKNFLNYDIFQAYTSTIIRKKLKEKGVEVDDTFDALSRIKSLGYTDVIVVSLHLIAGFEYEKILTAINKFEFDNIRITKPMLYSEQDYKNVALLLDDIYKDVEYPVVFMGHGSKHTNDIAYDKLQNELSFIKKDKYYMATIEGNVTIYNILKKLEEQSEHYVALAPFMLVCGDHANNDMAGEDDDSWVNILKNKNILSIPILKGLGEYEQVGNYFIQKINEVIKGEN